MSAAVADIKRSVVVSAPVEQAWEVFVGRPSDWWPLARHSIAGDDAVGVEIGPERVVERVKDGTEHTWGRVLAWEPPRRLAFTWEIDPTGRCGTEIEVRFSPEGDGTRVDLEHRGWPDETDEQQVHYASGWEFILDRYRTAMTG